MIADFQNKATGHWISIFKGSAKRLQQTNDGLWFRLPRSQISLSTILHNSRRSTAVGRVAGRLLLKDNRRTTGSLRLEIDSHVDAVVDMYEGNAFVHPVILAVEDHGPMNLA